MARITVEDCIDKFDSRFELVLVASNRARKLHAGENTSLEKDNDKNTVIALREIEKLISYVKDEESKIISNAISFSQKAHKNQIRKSGEPFEAYRYLIIKKQ